MARMMLRRSRPNEEIDEGGPDPVGPSAPTHTSGPVSLHGRPRLGELLVLRGLATAGQVSEALLKQQGSGQRLGALLVEMGFLNERDLTDVLAEHFGVALANLRQEAPAPDALELLPESVARANLALPLRLIDGCLDVAVADPTDEVRRLLTEGAGR